MADENEELVEYDESDDETTTTTTTTTKIAETTDAGETKKGSTYVGIHTNSFRDFLLKAELLRAITDCGFEHPSEVQSECIPHAMLGMDVVCQAKSGMGKTAVFVLTSLHQLDADPDGGVKVLVVCNTRELAYQIKKEFDRFSAFMDDLKDKVAVMYGGVPIRTNEETLKNSCPSILVGTPGRLLGLIKNKSLDLSKLKHFIVDECDKVLEALDMRKDVQTIFMNTPHDKQVMMFSATLSKEIRPVCRKFCQEPMEIYVDDDTKLTLHGLQQYYVKLAEKEKNRKLNDLLDALEFNQVVIFLSKVGRVKQLNDLLIECNFPTVCIHGGLKQDERLERFRQFKEFEKRILVTTDLFARGLDIERVNIVINYDFPLIDEKGDGKASDTYLHRVGRAGRFGTKGLAVSFVSTELDAANLEEVQSRFEVDIQQLPDEIDSSSYMNN